MKYTNFQALSQFWNILETIIQIRTTNFSRDLAKTRIMRKSNKYINSGTLYLLPSGDDVDLM